MLISSIRTSLQYIITCLYHEVRQDNNTSKRETVCGRYIENLRIEFVVRNWLLLVMFSSGEERTDCDAGEGAFDVIFLMSLNMWSVLLEVKERGREEVTSGSGGKLCGVVAGAKAVDD